jgi:hypothetical protein
MTIKIRGLRPVNRRGGERGGGECGGYGRRIVCTDESQLHFNDADNARILFRVDMNVKNAICDCQLWSVATHPQLPFLIAFKSKYFMFTW